jgi:hypothetical protein
MSGPGGSVTKRDQRRDSRRAQFQQRQLERQRQRQLAIRNQRIQRFSIIGGSVLLVALLAVLVVTHLGGGTSTPTPVNMQLSATSHPANGQDVDGLSCQQEMVQVHYHAHLTMYANGHPVIMPAGVGIVAPKSSGAPALASNGDKVCLYPLHVHTTDNIIHIESPVDQPYNFGQFFDIFGEPLSATEIAGYKADASHPLTYETIDEKGVVKQYSDPRTIQFSPHQTIVVLYNSPHVKPTQFTDWAPGE